MLVLNSLVNKTGELSAQTGEALAKGKITPMRARMKENARQDRDQNSTNIVETPTSVEHTFNPSPLLAGGTEAGTIL